MALDKIQQLNKIIEDSRYILVTFSNDQDIDSVCSALAWKNFLEKKYKQVDIVCPGFSNHKNLHFLTGIKEIKSELTHLQKFTIKIDISDTKIDSLSYDIKDNWLSIHLNPTQGIITKNEMRTAQSSFKYDLIITINSQDLESLGSIFENNTDLFYRLPIVNLDHKPSNEHYGQFNWVEITATSTAENIYKLIKQIDPSAIHEDMATMLLTGIISKTHSFKTNNITPYTLNIASELIKIGADREQIVKHLYHNRSISSLKIWGQALSHLQSDIKLGIVWTSITRDDFIRSGANESDLNELIDELITNSPEARIILLLYEKSGSDGKVNGMLVCEDQHDAKLLTQPFNSQGDKKRALFVIENKTLKQAEEEVLSNLQKNLK
ncbi:MAG: DHH family phosphoesterase [bacterium]